MYVQQKTFSAEILVIYYIFIGRNEVVAKVMFLLVSVILSTGGGLWQGDPPARRPPPGKEAPLAGRPSPARRPPGKETPWQGDPPSKEAPPARMPPRKETPLARRPPPAYGQWAAGTHPTGMHSCAFWTIIKLFFLLLSGGFFKIFIIIAWKFYFVLSSR